MPVSGVKYTIQQVFTKSKCIEDMYILAGEMCLVDTSMMSTNFEVFVTYNTKTRGQTMFGNVAGKILDVSGYHDCNQLTSIHIWALI